MAEIEIVSDDLASAVDVRHLHIGLGTHRSRSGHGGSNETSTLSIKFRCPVDNFKGHRKSRTGRKCGLLGRLFVSCHLHKLPVFSKKRLNAPYTNITVYQNIIGDNPSSDLFWVSILTIQNLLLDGKPIVPSPVTSDLLPLQLLSLLQKLSLTISEFFSSK